MTQNGLPENGRHKKQTKISVPEFFQANPILIISIWLDTTYATYGTYESTPIKYSLNLRFIQPSLTKPYTGLRVSFLCIFFIGWREWIDGKHKDVFEVFVGDSP